MSIPPMPNGSMNVPVVPAPYVRPAVNITNVQLRVMNLNLFTDVTISATLFENKMFIDAKQYILTGFDYTNWMNDDAYIVDYVLTKLGLTQSPAVTVTTA